MALISPPAISINNASTIPPLIAPRADIKFMLVIYNMLLNTGFELIRAHNAHDIY
jgi:hypothetical protein